MIDSLNVKKDFPIFKANPELVYLDSAAMSLKPEIVIEAVNDYYRTYSANVFRGIYALSEKATEAYEETRIKVARFINAKSEKEVVFVRNTTEAVNLVAYSWGRVNIDSKSEIVTTIMEHHSNFIPWQQLILENGATLKIIDIDDMGKLMLDGLSYVINDMTKLVAITQVSNALGTINPVKEIIATIKKRNPKTLVLVDAAQSVPHMKVDVQDLGCDFLVFSGQKMLGPTGAGVLWGKTEILESMPPFLFGGEMIREVYTDRSIFNELPHKFEAGTPHIAGVIGLGKAVDYLSSIGMDHVRDHEKKLMSYALDKIRQVKNITIHGPDTVAVRSGVMTFTFDHIHPHDIAQVLDESSICVRSGHHCAMPLHTRMNLDATVRATFYLYNTKNDIDKLIMGLRKVSETFTRKKAIY